MSKRRPVLVTLCTYRYGEGFEVARVLRRRSRLFALVTAKRLLPVVETTRYPDVYHRAVQRAPFCDLVYSARRPERVESEVRIVPSVGEVGVW